MRWREGVRRVLPIIAWLPDYRFQYLPGDLLAGITVWALLVPEAIAYAGIAGVPPEYGLYAVPLALIAYAAFASSRHLFVGPSSTVAAISAVTVLPLALGNQSRYLALTIAFALLVGIVFLFSGWLKLGFLARFFAKPVLKGFVIGLAFYIAVGQSGKLFGVHTDGSNVIMQVTSIFQQTGNWSWPTLLVGSVSLLLLLLLRRYLPRIPAALLALVLAITFSLAFNLANHGVAVVGEIPTGLPKWSLEGLEIQDFLNLLPGALAALVVGFAESLASAKVYAEKYNEPIDPNQEMIGYGMANLGSALFQGFVVSGSLSKTAAGDMAGGKTPIVLFVCSGLTLLTILFLAGFFTSLPEAVLATVVIYAVWGLIEFQSLASYWRVRKGDFAFALVAMLGVVLLGILQGILIGIVLSLVAFITRASLPHVALLGQDPSGTRYGELSEHADYMPVPGLIIYRFDGPLFFANADRFTAGISALVQNAKAPPREVIVDCEAVVDIDTTAMDELCQLQARMEKKGISIVLARVHIRMRQILQRGSSVCRSLDLNSFPTVRDAVQAFLKLQADPVPPVPVGGFPPA